MYLVINLILYMFTISHKLNKEAKATVVFVDDNFNFKNQSNYFSKADLIHIDLFKNDFGKDDIVKFDLFKQNKKQKIILYKLNNKTTEFDYQKAGGLIFKELKSCLSVNILIESFPNIQNNIFLFFTNFLLGFFSRSYKFDNYKLKKNDKDNLLKSL